MFPSTLRGLVKRLGTSQAGVDTYMWLHGIGGGAEYYRAQYMSCHVRYSMIHDSCMSDVRCPQTPSPPGFRRGVPLGQTCPESCCELCEPFAPQIASCFVMLCPCGLPGSTSTTWLLVLAAGAGCLGHALAELDQEVLCFLCSPLVLFLALCSSCLKLTACGNTFRHLYICNL